MNAGSMGDWTCEIQLPQEHMETILTAWKNVWYDQLKQQIAQTEVEKEAFRTAAEKTSQDYMAAVRLNRFLTKSIPEYNEGEEDNVQHWVARFKYEFPWPLTFTGISADHEDRLHFQYMRPVEELMEQMAAANAADIAVDPGQTLPQFVSQGLKRPAPSEFSDMQSEPPTPH